MKYLDELRAQARKALTAFEDSGRTAHAPTTGDEREDIVKHFVRPFLANCYGLDTGTAFSSLDEGGESRQLDIVIHDTVFSTAIPLGRTGRFLFPCESVYGSIEVKSRLDADELATAVENVASLKRLPREASDMLDITPLARLPVGKTLTYDRQIKNPYLGVVFALDGLTVGTAQEFLLASSVAPALLPDFIFNMERQYMIVRCQREAEGRVVLTVSDEYNGFVAFNTGNDTLPFFVLLLNSFLRCTRLRQPDPSAIWLPLVQNHYLSSARFESFRRQGG